MCPWRNAQCNAYFGGNCLQLNQFTVRVLTIVAIASNVDFALDFSNVNVNTRGMGGHALLLEYKFINGSIIQVRALKIFEGRKGFTDFSLHFIYIYMI